MNTIYRYLKWDGYQNEFNVDTLDMFKEFSNFLMEGWTPDEAFEWILKQGINSVNIPVIGIDELRSQLSRYKEFQFQNYSLKESLSTIKEELTKIVAKELSAIRNKFHN
ncbi:MAG: hypothetical protein ACE5H1_08195, partial [Thermodesulfobacteriota bacterium]